tara:strand:+ start:1662 stop:2750 length:1089 start_codon:yes stop_codon:yes gene_type:complete
MTGNEKKYTNDPAFKHIKGGSAKYKDWRQNLSSEELAFYNSNPLPFLAQKAENYTLFLKRFKESKNGNSERVPLSQKMKSSFNKNLKEKNACPKCGSLVNLDEKFCGECGFNLEDSVSRDNIEVNNSTKKNQDPAFKHIHKSNWKSFLNKEELEYLENHPSPMFEGESAFKQSFPNLQKFIKTQKEQENKPLKIKTKKTALICSECGFPLNDREDVFCPECGCKIIYPTDEVNTKTIEIKNSTKGNEFIKAKVSETEDSIQEESLVSNKEIKEKPKSQNNLPIDILIDLKSFFEDKLINEIEYNQLRKLALKISTDPKSNGNLSKIKSISREKLSELRNLFNEQLIDKDEYDDLRKNLIEIE